MRDAERIAVLEHRVGVLEACLREIEIKLKLRRRADAVPPPPLPPPKPHRTGNVGGPLQRQSDDGKLSADPAVDTRRPLTRRDDRGEAAE